ncbi:MAG TPA: hypothetical protein VFM46_05420, partial [Pseudomonadales bacterium]|nr:hypothetical protein [Pseudomonadales bacterium]
MLSIALIAMVGFIGFLVFSFHQSVNNTRRIEAIKNQYTPQLEWARLNVLELDNFSREQEIAVTTDDSDMLTQAQNVSVQEKKRFQQIIENQPSLTERVKEIEALWDDYVNYSMDFSKNLMDHKVKPADIKTIQQESQRRRRALQAALNSFLQER